MQFSKLKISHFFSLFIFGISEIFGTKVRDKLIAQQVGLIDIFLKFR
ncbi:hypothetical protein N473_18100 [Pseudoalteromonas luteoviolacea CPMOR-1]|uniref:Uncharacterized protein n=1 Tax=Pseudoalteromonas luteoviolacea CPMOR-1 TaxID=1365248 RepID=A0A167KI20_9GAMM|nr:hypothetical protein N473_18100 [Pseudoalteromonas luteoviolacea CPMOR-1]